MLEVIFILSAFVLFGIMGILVDDIGSFPLPGIITGETYNTAYRLARDAITAGKDIRNDEFLFRNFYDVTIDSFKKKIGSGLDVINSPWHYDGILQVSDLIHKAMEKGSFVVDEKDAFLPEVSVIEAEAKTLYEEFGKKIMLRVCLYGPMEQYLKEIGTVSYIDVLEGFAETIRRFAKNSVIDTKYVKTAVVSIDEPSFGFLEINEEKDVLCAIMEKAFDFTNATKQIHLHSSVRLHELLNVRNIDVLSFEYAASPKNIESVSKRLIDRSGKKLRIGVSRTDIDSITAELYDKGIVKPTEEQLVESQATIVKRYLSAKEKFGDVLAFSGPDCGLGGWPSQKAALLLLSQTVKAIKSV